MKTERITKNHWPRYLHRSDMDEMDRYFKRKTQIKTQEKSTASSSHVDKRV